MCGLQNLAQLLEARSAACIHEVSQGVLGAACNLVKAAVCEALAAGRTHLSQDDLEVATDRHVIGLGLYHRNPFRHGYADAVVAARVA